MLLSYLNRKVSTCITNPTTAMTSITFSYFVIQSLLLHDEFGSQAAVVASVPLTAMLQETQVSDKIERSYGSDTYTLVK